ncbi:acyltransferase domain-containing protein [Actinoplanes sp. NPDC051861]|uniref:acyltransferase domain-containing protein n=1 Tax=Actinoplanes sp. NPDC051861 TaxID=3155170 RepID=UPI0034196D53
MSEPIAVVGMSCRFPGAPDPDAFWAALRAGTDAITEVPRDRFDVDARLLSRYGGFLDRVDEFDAAFFGVPPHAAARMDPQQRLLLEVGWEAIEDSGLGPAELTGRPTGVFVGQLTTNYWEMLSRAGILDIYANLGTARSALSGRLSYAFDLHGPSISIDSACSSSLSAVHLACRSLASGECDTAIAAAVNLILMPEESITFSSANMLAPDGRCKFATDAADGYVRSEGVAALVLKPLSRAVADGDPVHAVLLGSAVTNDGRSGGTMMSPGREGQVRTLRAAYRDAGVDPDEIGYVEAHGTGTSAGDPVELGSLTDMFGTATRTRPLLVGSVKTNIGHTEAAAGMAGLIKAILCVKHRQIPATLHGGVPTPAVDWANTPIEVVREETGWPDGRAVAGVNSFGISGTNAHVIVAEHDSLTPRPATDAFDDRPGQPQLLALSASGPAALRSNAVAWADFLSEDVSLGDVCRSAATRHRLDSRLTVIAESAEEMAAALRADHQDVAHEVTPVAGRTLFVFPGQGSQWIGMGRELYESSPAFRRALGACDAAVRAETGWSVIERLHDPDGPSGIDQVQPCLWAIEVALAALWRALGITPDAVVGHSMGEVAAAHVAGRLSLADAAAVICRRSALMAGIAGNGAMASVELGADAVAKVLAEIGVRAGVAVENAPDLTVIAGDEDDVRRAVERFEADGVFARLVNVDVASHSPAVDPLLDRLTTVLADLRPSGGEIRMISTVTGTEVGAGELGAAYWADNLRRPVRFAPVIGDLLAAGYDTVIEISPHPILVSAVNRCGSAATVLPTLRRDEPERRTILEALADLYRSGRDVPLDAATGAGGPAVRLPRYRWQRQSHWIPGAPVAAHPLLGSGPLDLRRNAYLLDHRVQEHAVLPGTAYLEMMRAAVGDHTALRDVRYLRGLYLTADQPPEVRVSVTPGAVEVHSRTDAADDWLLHAAAVTVSGDFDGTEKAHAVEDVQGFPHHWSGESFYRRFAESGNGWLGAFRALTGVWRSGDVAIGRVEAAPGLVTERHHFHPALLDGCGQVLAATLDEVPGPFMLDSIEQMVWHRVPSGPLWSRVTRRAAAPGLLVGDVTIVGEDGALLAEMTGLTLRFIEEPEPAAAPAPAAVGAAGRFAVEWVPVARPGAGEPGDLLLFADRQGAGAALAAAWPGRVVTVRAGLSFRSLGPDRYEIAARSAADHRRLIEELAAGSWSAVAHLWSLDTTESAPDAGLLSALALVQALADKPLPGGPALWLATRDAQAVTAGDRVGSVRAAALWGLGRTVAAEHPGLRCRLLDLPASPLPAGALASELAATDDGENQIALRGDARYVARLRPASTGAFNGSQPGTGWQVRSGGDGLLAGVAAVPVVLTAPGSGEVAIRVSHAGINFRDVLVASGTYPGAAPGGELGWECAGEIDAVGPGVAGFAPGDRVMAFAPGAMAGRVVADARLVFPVPGDMGTAEAATLPIAFLTAWHGLVELARLERGERVLIHSGTGGVGLAAIQVARLRGAEVYATAGTPERRALLRMLGVAGVADSRGGRFAEQIRAATRGAGVDVVLSALPGEGAAANLAVLAPYGRYVEIGKQSGPIGALGDNATYVTLDVTDLIRRRPEVVARTFDRVLRAVTSGDLTPLPYEAGPVGDAAGTFERMTRSRHTGKLVLDLTGDEPGPEAVRPAFSGAATYLVTGGLGDLGLQVARWLADNGARHLVLIGRSAPPPEDRWESLDAGDPWRERVRHLRALSERGIRVAVETADVADSPAVEALLRKRKAGGEPPVRGVIHAAGVLGYGPISGLNADDLAPVLGAKAAGATVLHRLLAGEPLDFFVLFSSASGVLASPMLGSYAAANATLDALALHRRALGLPALSVDWGFWDTVGMAARLGRERGRALHPQGIRPFSVAEGLATLGELLAGEAAQTVVLPADWVVWRRAYPDAAASPLLRDLLDGQHDLLDGQHAASANAPTPQAVNGLQPAAPAPTAAESGHATNGHVGAAEPVGEGPEAFLLTCLGDVLGTGPAALNPQRPLNRQGLDSLMAARVRGAVHQRFGLLIPITRMLGGASLADLSAELTAHVRGN